MKYIKLALYVAFADFALLLRRCFGCKVKYNFVNLVSPGATLQTKGNSRITIGRKSTVRKNTELSATNGMISIGNNVFVNRNCLIVAHERITIGEGTTIGPGTFIYDHDHDGKGGFTTKSVSIGCNAWIGAGCIILKGVTIGENAVVGAGTVVTHDVAPNSTVYQKRITEIR